MMRQATRPICIRPGDTIGIVSTSSPVAPGDLAMLVGYFQSRGHPVRVFPHVTATTGYLAGTAADRAADLMAAYEDPDVRLIVPASGGKGAAHLLDLLDYSTIAKGRKLLVGLSDPSILANAIMAKTGLFTLHGPTGYDFSRAHIEPETEFAFWRIVSEHISDVEVVGADWRVIRGGGCVIDGPVVGGHLGTIRALIGTPWMPSTHGAILILEEVFVSWTQIDSALTHLRLAGALDGLSALMFGIPVDCPREDAPDSSLDDLILRCVMGKFPIITNVAFGHTERKIPLPLGGRIELNLTGSNAVLRYCEDFVAL